jgi:hypothetical protein
MKEHATAVLLLARDKHKGRNCKQSPSLTVIKAKRERESP